ncbi:MAG TPA: SDR family oxidoreductase [Acidimicrobiales bacterium]|jgi:NAD(P)-dependent dehydrogenase (short-subunit alcohol dehydrogenase family)|nr:SDR family oxidoreductase [Acidimicrobiales bacterium]
MDLGLKDAVILVTGGTDGLGLAVAERLALEEGARVAFCSRTEARVRSTEERLLAAGGAVVGVVADVTSAEDLERFVDATISCWGRIDGLVNNAGRHAGDPFESISDADWYDDIDLKVMAAVRLCRLVLPHMRSAGGGSIVNVLAIAAKAPVDGSLPSSATRAAGLALTKALSMEVAPDNIRVNAVLIGSIASGQGRRRAEAVGISEEAYFAALGKGVPLRRIGTGEDFADLATYLLSRRSGYVTGTSINLDGGKSPAI